MSNGDEDTKKFEAALKALLKAEFPIAEEILLEILERKPDHSSAWNLLGKVYRHSRQYQKAFDTLRKAATVNPNILPQCWIEIGQMLCDNGQFQDAISAFEFVLERAPDNSVAYRELGSIYANLKDFDKAVEYLEKSLQLKDDDPRTHFTLGNLREIAKDWSTAVKCYENAVKFGSEDRLLLKSYYYFFGYALAQTGKIEEGISYIEKAIELNPKDLRAWKSLQYYYNELGNKTKVAECAAKIQSLSKK